MLGKIAYWLVIIGGINWGLVGLLDMDLIANVLGPGTTATKVVYDLVGLSAVYMLIGMKK
jgi:uncharacterized membrane protein YuzA (DUF378 family)